MQNNCKYGKIKEKILNETKEECPMKKLKYNVEKSKGITLVALAVTIIILLILTGISINLTLGDNGLITMAKKAKEDMQLAQIEEQKNLNELYTQIENEEFEGDITVGELEKSIEELQRTVESLNSQLEEEKAKKEELEKKVEDLTSQLQQEQTDKEELEGQIGDLNTQLDEKEKTIQGLQSAKDALEKQVADLQSQVDSLKKQVADLKAKQATGNATEADVLSGKTFSKSGSVGLTGSMENHGAVTPPALSAGGIYTIPKGYHNGLGTVTAQDLASQTQATATASDIAKGKTAWVNGELLTGIQNQSVLSSMDLLAQKTLVHNDGYYSSEISGSVSFTITKNYSKISVLIFAYTQDGTPKMTANLKSFSGLSNQSGQQLYTRYNGEHKLYNFSAPAINTKCSISFNATSESTTNPQYLYAYVVGIY